MESQNGILGKEIDLYEVIAAKRPEGAKPLPKFVMRYLHRLLCVDQINQTIRNIGDLEGIDFLEKVFSENIPVELEIINSTNLDNQSRGLFIANHPLGGVDGMLLMKVIGQRYPGKCRMVANDFLLNIKQLADMFIPVNKVNKQSNREYFKLIEKSFSSDDSIIVFPAGLCSRKFRKEILDLEWHKSFIKRSRQYERDVIPIHVDGANSNKFYRVARWRRLFRIKFNIEMMYLVGEMFGQAGHRVAFTVGEPIPYGMFDDRYSDWEWAAKLRQYVYELKKDPKAIFNPDKEVSMRKTWLG